MRKTTALLAVAAVLGLAACGSSYNNSSSNSSSGTSSSASGGGGGYGGAAKSSTTAAAASTSSSSGKTTHEVDMYDNYFKSKTITGKAGSTVKVKLKNEGQREHNFKIDSQKANVDLQPGKTGEATVKIPASGSVQFYCEYHKGLGMVGTVKPS